MLFIFLGLYLRASETLPLRQRIIQILPFDINTEARIREKMGLDIAVSNTQEQLHQLQEFIEKAQEDLPRFLINNDPSTLWNHLKDKIEENRKPLPLPISTTNTEYGLGILFNSAVITYSPEREAKVEGEEGLLSKLKATPNAPLLLTSLKAYTTDYLGVHNSLLTQLRFGYIGSTGEKVYIPFEIHMGLFISGYEYDYIDPAKDQMENARRTFEARGLSKKEREDITGIVEKRKKKEHAYKTPTFSTNQIEREQALPNLSPVSFRALHADASGSNLPDTKTLKEKQLSFIQARFLPQEKERENTYKLLFNDPTRFREINDTKLFESEYAYLHCVENPNLKYIEFVERDDGRLDFSSIPEDSERFIENSFFSYRDICKYCRGTFSYLLGKDYLKDKLFLFVNQELPERLLQEVTIKNLEELKAKIRVMKNIQYLLCGKDHKSVSAYLSSLSGELDHLTRLKTQEYVVSKAIDAAKGALKLQAVLKEDDMPLIKGLQETMKEISERILEMRNRINENVEKDKWTNVNLGMYAYTTEVTVAE